LIYETPGSNGTTAYGLVVLWDLRLLSYGSTLTLTPTAPKATAKSRETVDSYWRVWSEKNVERLLALNAPTCAAVGFAGVYAGLSHSRPTDRDEFATGLKACHKAFSDVNSKVVSPLEERDNAARQVATSPKAPELPSGSTAPTNGLSTSPVSDCSHETPADFRTTRKKIPCQIR
jgi:hypothetical protein